MPGGAGVVAVGYTEHPEMAAKFIDFIAQDENAKFLYGSTFAIPAHAALQAEGIDYSEFGADANVAAALNTFAAGAARAAEETPQAYQLQGSPVNFVMYNTTAEYVTAAINGEMSVDEALDKMRDDIAEQTK